MTELPLDPSTSILMIYSLAGGVLLLLGAPLYLKKIPPNSLYGFRTRRTLADAKLWYAVNRVVGRGMLLAGAATLAVANGLQWRGYGAAQAAKINLAVFVCGVLLTICLGFFACRRDG